MDGCSFNGATSDEAVLGDSDGTSFCTKKNTTFNLLTILVVKTEVEEGAPMVDIKEAFSVDLNNKTPASTSASTGGQVYPLFCFV